MCKRCDEEEKDPRNAAFQTVAMIESLSVKERKKLSEGASGQIVVTAFTDHGEAKFTAYAMKQDPALEGVKLTATSVCLN